MIAHTYQMTRQMLLSQGRVLAHLDLEEMEALARGQGKCDAEMTMISAAISFARACQTINQKGAQDELAR
jgi:hypothetical protein